MRDPDLRPEQSYIIMTDPNDKRQVELFQPDRYWRLEASYI